MRVHSRSGFAATALGAALVISSLAVSHAGAVAVENPTTHAGNVTTCADVGFSGAIQLEGAILSGTYLTALVDYTVVGDTAVTLTRVAPAITILAVAVKGGPNYHVYSTPLDPMVSPLNGGTNVPALSHWYLCYRITPVDTTTTVVDTTTTVVDATTTMVDDTTTTVVDDTTTTLVDAEGPTTTIADTTTTLVAADGPTTTLVAAGGPTTTVAPGSLPRTGTDGDLIVMLGLAMVLGGVVTMLLGRRSVAV